MDELSNPSIGNTAEGGSCNPDQKLGRQVVNVVVADGRQIELYGLSMPLQRRQTFREGRDAALEAARGREKEDSAEKEV
jgi:hypothetical protein